MYDIKDMFRDIHYDVENYKKTVRKLSDELDEYTQYIESVFTRRFKVRGIHARVDNYSLKENWIDLLPAPPDCGVDRLNLTFKEFAQQVEFIEEDKK